MFCLSFFLALSSSGDDCILSSLSYHLPNVDNDEGDALCSESQKEINSEVISNVERNGQQHVDDLTEDQGASVEVILPPSDESESNDDDMDKKWFNRLKTGSSKSFKCLVCGKDFGSCSKLKKHKITHSGCFTKTSSQSNSTSQSSFFEKINLHPKPKTCVENNASSTENELSSSATTHNTSNLNSLPNFERSNDDSSLVCHVCGKAFTYPKNFDKHQRTCVVKRQAETNPQSFAHHSKPNTVDTTKESSPSEAETEPTNVVPQESICSDSPQTCKRSSRVKQCSVCGKIFTCSADLTRHMRCHTEQSPYFCSYCGKDFESYEDCEAHQEGKCRISNQDKSSSKRNQENSVVVSSGTTHIPTITDASANSQDKSPMTCKECGQCFIYIKSFEKHQSKCCKREPRRKKRTNTNHFVITACNFRTTDNTSSEMKETTKTPSSTVVFQTKSRSIKCTMCEKNFSDIVLMKRHYSKSHKVRGSYPCPLCKRTFVRLCELVRHQQNKKLYQCAACKKCYTKPGLLNDHEKVHTASVPPCICETCGKSFKTLAYLILHQSKHREQQPSVCSYCGKQFSTKDCLRAHMVRHTGGYPCPVCGKKFYQKTYLKWHLYKHTGQEPYLCDTCGKGWPSAAQLKLHMVQHTEERPFKCEDCGACYKRGSHLMAHRRAKHIRLRPFACEVCSKAFRLNNELKKHMMVHTGERPFTCTRCDKTFTRKSRLREHREKACL